METSTCIHSGYCCKQGPCPFGNILMNRPDYEALRVLKKFRAPLYSYFPIMKALDYIYYILILSVK